jgi:hypothetical protein
VTVTLTTDPDRYQVRVYDEATKTCVGKLCGGYTKTSQGHSNRIFSVNLPHLLTLTNPSSNRILSVKLSPTKPQP